MLRFILQAKTKVNKLRKDLLSVQQKRSRYASVNSLGNYRVATGHTKHQFLNVCIILEPVLKGSSKSKILEDQGILF